MAGLLANGSVPTTLADTALKHLFKVQMRLGMFDEADAQPPWAKYEHAPCIMDLPRTGFCSLRSAPSL